MALYHVGSGHDSHRLVEGRPLVLGGVRIEHPKGLVGHSDADVVLHAVTDALLGAAGLGDIGELYPDTDPLWKGADSRLFLVETLGRLNQAGWRPVNLDVTVFVQEPRLGPVNITGYHVIVYETGGEGLPEFDIDLPASETNVRVPVQFLKPSTTYQFEVLSTEESGNQTITEGFFCTTGVTTCAMPALPSR